MKNEIIIKKIMNEVERIEDVVEKEFNDFQTNQIIFSTTSEMFENAGKIHTMTNLNSYFIDGGFSDMIDIELNVNENNDKRLMVIYNSLLSIVHTNILENLYDQISYIDNVDTSSWYNIDLLIKCVLFDKNTPDENI